MSKGKKVIPVAHKDERFAMDNKTGEGAPLSDAPGTRTLTIQSSVPGIKSLTDLFSTTGRPVKKLTLPPIVKPSQVSAGISIEGKVIKVIPSPVTTYRSNLLVMEHPVSKANFCFPITAVIKRALAGNFGVGAKDIDTFKDDQAVGLTLVISGLGKTKTQGGNDVTLFEVGIVE